MTERFRFSNRTDWDLMPNEISQKFEDVRREGKQIIDLTVSNPTKVGFIYGQELLDAFNDPQNLRYDPEPRGLIRAREAVCRYYEDYGLSIDPDQVFLTSSTSEAYSFLFRLLGNVGDELLFPSPSYPLFQYLVSVNDMDINYYPLVYQNGWSMDMDALEPMLNDRVRGIVMVNPNNPTGSFVSEKEMRAINDLIQGKNIALICDEVFYDYPLRDEKYLSFASNKENPTFVLSGLSKIIGLPQMKLSWIVINGPQDFIKTAANRLEVIADTFLSVNTPSQNALVSWLENRSLIQRQIQERIRGNLFFLQKLVSETDALELLKPDGGWSAVLELPQGIPEDGVVLNLLQQEQVFVHPGYFFDFAQESYIVLSLLPELEKFQDGFKKFVKFLSEKVSE